MLMHEQPDLLDIYLGKQTDDLLTVDFSAYASPIERDQQLDLELPAMDPTDDQSIMYLNYGMNNIAEQCPQLQDQIVEVQSQEVLSEVPQYTNMTSVSSNNSTSTCTTATSVNSDDNFVFQFPSGHISLDNSTSDMFNASNEIIVEVIESDATTDTEGGYTLMTAPNTPFSPTTPSSLPPATPDTASSTDSGNMPSFSKLDCVKHSLKYAIKSKRQREGKSDLKVEFLPPPPEQLTTEEEAKRCEKREKNKLAAQKCREKKRQRIDELEAETKKLKQRQNAYKLEVQKLIDERDRLMDIISIHSQVCPHFRAQVSNN